MFMDMDCQGFLYIGCSRCLVYLFCGPMPTCNKHVHWFRKGLYLSNVHLDVYYSYQKPKSINNFVLNLYEMNLCVLGLHVDVIYIQDLKTLHVSRSKQIQNHIFVSISVFKHRTSDLPLSM